MDYNPSQNSKDSYDLAIKEMRLLLIKKRQEEQNTPAEQLKS